MTTNEDLAAIRAHEKLDTLGHAVKRLRAIADNLERRALDDMKAVYDLRAAADGMEKGTQNA